MLTIPFSLAAGPESGPAKDGVIRGAVPQVPLTASVRGSRLVFPAQVLLGNADALGNIAFSDVTALAQGITPGGFGLFDLIAPPTDELVFALPASTLTIVGLVLLVTIPGTGSGVWTPAIDYWNGAADVSVGTVVDPSNGFRSGPGLVILAFPPLTTMTVSVSKYMEQIRRWIRLRVTGITTVTTAPVFGRAWLLLPAPFYHDVTALVNQGTNPNFASEVAEVVPVSGNIQWFMLNRPFVKLRTMIYRPAGPAGVEWVYQGAAGPLALPASAIVDGSNLLRAELTSYSQAFLPSDVAGRQVHFRPEELPASGAVSQWTDVSGNARHATQATAANQPTVGTLLNGSTTVDFGGATDVLATAAVPALHETNATIFAVFRDPSLSDNELFGQNDGVGRRAFIHPGWSNGNVYFDLGNAVASRIFLASPFIGAAFHIVTARRQGANGEAWNNGTSIITSTTLDTPVALTVSVFSIGAAADGTSNFNGVIAEIIVYNVALSVADRQSVEGYLAWKYGLQTSLPAGHPYLAAPPMLVKPGPTSYLLSFSPPTDWASATVIDDQGVARTGFPVGLRSTVDGAGTVAPLLCTLTALPLSGSDIGGIPSPETATYTRVTISVRTTSPSVSQFLVCNAASGQQVALTLPANAAIATVTGLIFSVVKGDPLVLIQMAGDRVTNIADGVVWLA